MELLTRLVLVTANRLFCVTLFTAMLFISPKITQAQYRFYNWNTDNGLPQNSVYDILQTRDGFFGSRPWMDWCDTTEQITPFLTRQIQKG